MTGEIYTSSKKERRAKLKIEHFLKGAFEIYAHLRLHDKETLKEHSERTMSVFNQMNEKFKVLENIREAFVNMELRSKFSPNTIKLSSAGIEMIVEMFEMAVYLHDIGKINPLYQINKMKNLAISPILKSLPADSNHSPLSALIFLSLFHNRASKLGTTIEEKVEVSFLRMVMLQFSFCVYQHHGKLENIEEFFTGKNNNVSKYKNEVLSLMGKADYFDGITFLLNKRPTGIMKEQEVVQLFDLFKVKDMIEFDQYAMYWVSKTLYSCIIRSDYVATDMYMNNRKNFELNTILNIDTAEEELHKYKTYRGVENIRKGKVVGAPINVLRTELFSQAEENLLRNKDQDMFFIKQPTGSGKSFTSINCSIQLIKECSLQNIVYVMPFNTLTRQMANELQDIFEKSMEWEVINGVSGITERMNGRHIDYSRTLTDRVLWNYQGVVTSHVSLFDVLFGTSKEPNMAFLQLCNSVLVLDEIQSYKNTIWPEIMAMLQSFAKFCGTKIIIMSATFPPLDKLTGVLSTGMKYLIDNPEDYFKNPIFANRVECRNDLMQYVFNGRDGRQVKACMNLLFKTIVKEAKIRNKTLEREGVIKPTTSALVEFIKKKTAQKFYEEYSRMLEADGFVVYEIDGDTPSYLRDEYIQKIKTNTSENIILIATQVVEAGIDIDMDLGFKDTSLMDVEEQFLGRINRSCLKKYCYAFFFSLDSESDVYKQDLRINMGIGNKKYWDMLVYKELDKYYEELFDKIEEVKKELNEEYGLTAFEKNVKLGNFERVKERLTLINSDTIQIFIPQIISVNGKMIDGNVVWKQYVDLLQAKHISYPEQRIRIKKLSKELSFFTFSVYGTGIVGEEPVGGIYFLDRPDLLKSGKIDSDKLKEEYKIS